MTFLVLVYKPDYGIEALLVAVSRVWMPNRVLQMLTVFLIGNI